MVGREPQAKVVRKGTPERVGPMVAHASMGHASIVGAHSAQDRADSAGLVLPARADSAALVLPARADSAALVLPARADSAGPAISGRAVRVQEDRATVAVLQAHPRRPMTTASLAGATMVRRGRQGASGSPPKGGLPGRRGRRGRTERMEPRRVVSASTPLVETASRRRIAMI